MDNSTGDGSDDYIYRGGASTPQDGQPWEPPSPAGPPPTSPQPTSPPPGYPPPSPPESPAFSSPAQPAAKKKRWPWIVAGALLFCGLPLGACVGLVAFGVGELNERSDEIDATVADFFDAANSEDWNVVEGFADGQTPCMTGPELTQVLENTEPGWMWTPESTGFVERTGNTTLSSNADPEGLFIDGRETQSAAVVTGRLERAGASSDVQIMLSQPVSSWRICTISVR